jgi:hypothetical protein
MGMYELEARFYQDVASMLPHVGLARCYLAQLADDDARFTLVLEDLKDMRAGDVLAAATDDECTRALAELVKFQAPLWNSKDLANLGWLSDTARTVAVFDSLPAGLEPFLARFGDRLDPEHVKLFESVVPRSGEWVRSWTPPTVVQHGDFRSDNIMFSTDPSVDRLAILDFQTVRLGPPGLDPAYYLGYGVFLFVGMASQVEASERAEAIITDQIRRYADMAIDLEAPLAAGLT